MKNSSGMRKFIVLFIAVSLFAISSCGLKTDPQPPKKGGMPVPQLKVIS